MLVIRRNVIRRNIAFFACIVLHCSLVAAQGDTRFAPATNGRSVAQTQTRQPQAVPQTRRISQPSDGAESDGSPSQATTGVGGSMLKTVTCLLLVVGLILVLAKFFGKQSGALRLGLPKDAVEVLGRASLDSRQHIYLVRLGAQILVLGSSSGELRTLSEITDPVQVDLLAGACKQQSAMPSTTLMDLFKRTADPTSAAEVNPTPQAKAQFQQKLHDRLSTPLQS